VNGACGQVKPRAAAVKEISCWETRFGVPPSGGFREVFGFCRVNAELHTVATRELRAKKLFQSPRVSPTIKRISFPGDWQNDSIISWM
jgi:hypothetical protein